ncbi:MAG: TRAP transporter substrate-binding protein DctP [Woeseiaceae bacterium]|nr:TRAP transporter substrate-binding protein DctP [Woeseiaceae bacterium]
MKKLLVLASLIAFGSLADAQTLRIATVTPENSQWMKDMRASAKEIKERTDGRVKIKYYGGGAMGNDKQVLAKIRLGSLAGGAFTPLALASRYPDLNLYGLPLVFNSEEEAAYVRAQLDERLEQGLEDKGFVNFGFAAGGFAVLMSNTPITSLEDMKGKRVWVPEGDPISYASMEALSLAPVTLPVTDVLTGLQTGLIDVVAMSPIGALVLQWHTKIKYVSELPLAYTLGFMAVDQKAFKKLSDADQAIVQEVMRATYDNFNVQNLVDNRAARDSLLSAKTGIKTIEFDRSEFEEVREVLLASNRELAEKGEFSLELYDEMLGHIEDYRSQGGQAASR